MEEKKYRCNRYCLFKTSEILGPISPRLPSQCSGTDKNNTADSTLLEKVGSVFPEKGLCLQTS